MIATGNHTYFDSLRGAPPHGQWRDDSSYKNPTLPPDTTDYASNRAVILDIFQCISLAVSAATRRQTLEAVAAQAAYGFLCKAKFETLLAVKFQFFGFHTPSKGNDRSSCPKDVIRPTQSVTHCPRALPAKLKFSHCVPWINAPAFPPVGCAGISKQGRVFQHALVFQDRETFSSGKGTMTGIPMVSMIWTCIP